MAHTDVTEEVSTKEEISIELPKKYKVLVHNDDKTTMDFVVFLLKNVFHMPDATAYELTMEVHLKEYGVAGVYTKEVAEEKTSEANKLASINHMPLKTTCEEE